MNKFVGNNIIVLLSETFKKTLASAKKSVLQLFSFSFIESKKEEQKRIQKQQQHLQITGTTRKEKLHIFRMFFSFEFNYHFVGLKNW